MTFRPLLAASFIVGLAACSACSTSSSSGFSGGDGGGDSSSGGTTLDKAANALAAAYCARTQACASAVVSIGYGDVATCTSVFAADVVRANKGTGVTETPDQINACATALAQLSCGDFLARKTAAACKVPAGTLADGAACSADAQCQGTRCKVAFGQV